jgi:hypothetical protein
MLEKRIAISKPKKMLFMTGEIRYDAVKGYYRN